MSRVGSPEPDPSVMSGDAARLAKIPSVDEVLKAAPIAAAIERFGRPPVVAAIRDTLSAARKSLKNGRSEPPAAPEIEASVLAKLEADARPRVRPVYNLTGTVLHTNLGRALFAEAAVEAATVAMREALALEFDLDEGKRGERDALIRGLLCELTGAEDATVVKTTPRPFCSFSTRSPRAGKRLSRAAS